MNGFFLGLNPRERALPDRVFDAEFFAFQLMQVKLVRKGASVFFVDDRF